MYLRVFKIPYPYFNIQSVHVCIQFTTHLQKIQIVHLVPVEREKAVDMHAGYVRIDAVTTYMYVDLS